MKSRVCHISVAHGRHDNRIYYKECTTLARHGYDTWLLIRAEEKEKEEGPVKISPLPQFPSRKQRFLSAPGIVFHKVMDLNPDLIHFHDPELIPVALRLKKRGIKVIYDVHELVNSQIMDKSWIGNPALREIVRRIYSRYERKAVLHFDGIVLAEDGYLDYFRERYPQHAEKTAVVRNYPVLSVIDSVPPAESSESRKILFYSGGLTRIRGIREVIRALGIMKDPPVLMIFGHWDEQEYKRQCMEEKGWQHTRDMGFVPPESVYARMKNAGAGIAMLYPLPNYLSSLPVKAFEYMAMGKPIIMSDFPFWKEKFEGCALFADPKDPEAIAASIGRLLDDSQLMKELGQTGRKRIEESYSWEREEKKLLDLYKRILEK